MSSRWNLSLSFILISRLLLNVIIFHGQVKAAQLTLTREDRSANEDGFTLLEILVAITVLSIGLLGMAGLTTSIIHGNMLSNKVTTATTLGQDRMEHFRRLGYSTIPTADTTTTEDYNSISNYPSYKRVSFIDVDSPSLGMKTVTITVFWNSDARSVVLQTILAQ